MKRRRHGFTILELLVVVAIIAVLASIILVSFTEVRLKSRDTKRISDMREIEKALVLYQDNIGIFPISINETVITSDDLLSQALEGEFVIADTPIDPLHDAYTYRYRTNAEGTTFTLIFCLEGDSIENFSPGCSNTITP